MDISAIASKIQVPAFAKKPLAKMAKHSPEILMAAGAGLVLGAGINACRQSLKARDILDEFHDDLDSVDAALNCAPDQYTDEDAKHDIKMIYVHTAVSFAKLYGPSVLVAMTGFGMIFGSHKILTDRNSALTMAYSNLLTAYTAYREKVIEELGAEKEFQLRSGYSKQDIEWTDEDGVSKSKKNAKVIDTGTTHSIYARIFDETCPSWSRSPMANATFLKAKQAYANDKLRAEGILFLNDVYSELGFPRTPEGQIVGWRYDPDDKSIDSFVDFGIYDKLFKSEEKRDFINGWEPCVWLDFNVDGVVYDKI